MAVADYTELPCGVLRFGADGRLQFANAEFVRLLGTDSAPSAGTPLGALMSTGSRVLFDTHLLPALRLAGRIDEAYLNFEGATGDVPVLMNARVTAEGATAVLLRVDRRERWEKENLDSRRRAEQYAKELAATSAELSAAKTQLEEQLAEIENSHWMLRRVSEVLPICVECGDVREGRDWTTLSEFLKRNASFLSHGYCPDCGQKALAALDQPE